MKKKITLPVILFFFLFNYLHGQLVVTGLHENSVIKKYVKTYPKLQLKTTTDTLELPFYDDFSSANVYPNASHWTDKDVFINNSITDYPLNLNVATFDAINDTGILYPHASTSEFVADYLTSKPIDLSQYNAADSIYLSFYYQPQGLAMDYPDFDDSLVLEFTTPDTSTWFHMWSVNGSNNKAFKQVMIPVTNPAFFSKGFTFRFKNYASLGDPLKPSWQSNCDFWHLDLVYMDTARTYKDTIIRDVGVLYLLDGNRSFINDFEAIPWTHFKESNIQPYSSLSLTCRNISDSAYNVTSEYELINVFAEDTLVSDQIGAENISEFTEHIFTKGITHSPMFEHDNRDSARFEIRANLVGHASIDSLFYVNDTISYFQSFYNFYAYDDGTPEAGIGVYGINTENGKFCVKYTTYQPDTLTALQIYFNNTNESNTKYFYLSVWADNNGEPGNLLYSTDDGIEAYYDGLNGFHNYLLDTTLVVSGTFYIGWQKVNTIEMMNVGFDVNRNVQDKVFYALNASGSWNSSTISGAPMIRPVFRSSYLLSKQEITNDQEITLYPNPASDIFSIKGLEHRNINLQIYDLSGSLIFSSKNSQIVSVNDLPTGIYYVHISDNKSFSTTKKLVVIK